MASMEDVCKMLKALNDKMDGFESKMEGFDCKMEGFKKEIIEDFNEKMQTLSDKISNEIQSVNVRIEGVESKTQVLSDKSREHREDSECKIRGLNDCIEGVKHNMLGSESEIAGCSDFNAESMQNQIKVGEIVDKDCDFDATKSEVNLSIKGGITYKFSNIKKKLKNVKRVKRKVIKKPRVKVKRKVCVMKARQVKKHKENDKIGRYKVRKACRNERVRRGQVGFNHLTFRGGTQ